MNALTKGSTVHFLLSLFACAVMLRLAVFIGYLAHENRYWQVDSHTYHQVATQLARGNGFINADGSAHFYRVPGYAFFLASCYRLCGEVKERALLMQVVISSFIPLIMYWVTLIFFPGNFLLARLVGIVITFHLGLVLYAGFMMTETLFIIFLLVGLGLLFKALMARRYALFLAFASGCMLGGASLIRPVGHYLMAVCFCVIAGRLFRWSWFRLMLVQGFGWLLVVSGWLLRNYLLTGTIFFHTLPGGHFLYLSAARVAMQVHKVDYQQARAMLEQQMRAKIISCEQAYGRKLLEIESCHLHEQLAKHYFLLSPMRTLQCWMTDIIRASCSLYSAELLFIASGRSSVAYFDREHGLWTMVKRYLYPNTDSMWLRCLVYAEIIFYIFLLMGFCRCLALAFFYQGAARVMVSQVMPFVALFIVIALAGGYARMRLPIEPLMILVSSYGWLSWVGSFHLR